MGVLSRAPSSEELTSPGLLDRDSCERLHGLPEERYMSDVIAVTMVTLDGVMQAPGRPDEDRRGGFPHGGWATPYAAMAQLGGTMANTGGLLLGRRTYEDFYDVWPKRKDNPYSTVLENMQKYVGSTTLKEPLPWKNSTLLAGDAADSVASLKRDSAGDLVILGSGELVRSLMRRNLIDTYVLLIHPLVLGSGRRLFADGGSHSALRLAESRTTTNGVIIATYHPADAAGGNG
jgi:dihydrofolate reductase